MFIVSLTYKTDLSMVDKHIEAHVKYLEKQYLAGHFIASGRKVPRTGGVILANVANKGMLDDILKNDPFYIAEVANYEVTEFIPTMVAEEFSVLKHCI